MAISDLGICELCPGQWAAQVGSNSFMLNNHEPLYGEFPKHNQCLWASVPEELGIPLALNQLSSLRIPWRKEIMEYNSDQTFLQLPTASTYPKHKAISRFLFLITVLSSSQNIQVSAKHSSFTWTWRSSCVQCQMGKAPTRSQWFTRVLSCVLKSNLLLSLSLN